MAELRTATPLNEGDAHYALRGNGRNGDVAPLREIDLALDGYWAAIAHQKEDLESRWTFLRATYFKAECTGRSDKEKAALYERALPIAEEAVENLKKRAGRKAGRNPSSMEPMEIGRALAGDVSAGEVFVWSSVNRGQWSLVHGKLKAVREGMASKIRDESKSAIGIDPALEDAGGYRVLGRLHSLAPSVPLFTGWVDRKSAVEFLEKANTLAPGNFFNELFLAEALHEFTDRKREAVDLLNALAIAVPHPDRIVEDLHAQSTARQDLAAWSAN